MGFVLACTAGTLLLATNIATSTGARADGRFEGELVFRMVGSRKFEILEEFIYIDPNGVRWPVPRGAKTDCASVPRWAWWIFPPCAGSHLKAAVVHDYYCETKSRPWEVVHRVFYDALLSAGVDSLSAKTMYAAVYRFGPKWLPGGGRLRSVGRNIPDAEKERRMKELRKWIAEKNPSLEAIEKRMAEIR